MTLRRPMTIDGSVKNAKSDNKKRNRSNNDETKNAKSSFGSLTKKGTMTKFWTTTSTKRSPKMKSATLMTMMK